MYEKGRIKEMGIIRVYILAAYSNVQFAEDILGQIKNIKIFKSENNEGIDLNLQSRKQIEKADVVLAIIDNKFMENKNLEFELRLAQMLVREDRNKLLIPIILDKAKVPTSIDKMLHIKCESNPEYDLSKIQKSIERILLHRKYNIKKEI